MSRITRLLAIASGVLLLGCPSKEIKAQGVAGAPAATGTGNAGVAGAPATGPGFGNSNVFGTTNALGTGTGTDLMQNQPGNTLGGGALTFPNAAGPNQPGTFGSTAGGIPTGTAVGTGTSLGTGTNTGSSAGGVNSTVNGTTLPGTSTNTIPNTSINPAPGAGVAPSPAP